MYVIFCCTVTEQSFLSSGKNSPISGFLFDLMVEGWPPRHFLFLVVSLHASRFGLYPNSGNRQERITLSSVSDKALM